ncbi:MAG: pseudouridine synthase [Cyclobacteriaceae bacterium]
MSTHRHFMIHKPFGFLSQFVTRQTKRKPRLLGELHNFPEGTMSIGRLDKDSEGLLLLTTDGKVSSLITGRKYEKEYYVQVDGEITEEAVAQLKSGVEISVEKQAYFTRADHAIKLGTEPDFPPRAKKIRDARHGPTSWISITISEGKFRQVRKMTAAVGFPTLRLIRVRIGELKLGSLQTGQFREVDNLL